jgi:DNA polymerase elongation subunit (family B)
MYGAMENISKRAGLNVCLQDEDDIPDAPSADIPQGVLPRLIATLVGRRKQVKSLMKDASTAPVKMMQVCALLGPSQDDS